MLHNAERNLAPAAAIQLPTSLVFCYIQTLAVTRGCAWERARNPPCSNYNNSGWINHA